MRSSLSRRRFVFSMIGAAGMSALALNANALTVEAARDLVDRLIADINKVIASGKSESAMFVEFERIFASYADTTYIALSALGPAGRSASKAQKQSFVKAYQGYISRKYGRRFREFIGGKIEVTDARPVKSFYEVVSVARLQGQSPFEVRWQVFDKSGKDRFFNIIIEGVNMLSSERSEIGSLLDKNKGDIDKLIATLNAT